MRRRLSHAEKLLQSYGIGSPEDIDLETLAFCCGIQEVREERLDGCEAQIIGHKDKAFIIVNSKSSYERKRFSIGHELGHWHYHRGQPAICRADEIGNFDVRFSAIHPERVADDFASNLLMPEYMFSPLAKKCEHACFDAILEFKKRFNTSITATALRFVELSPEPCLLVCYDQNGNRKWFKPNRDIPSKLFPHERLDRETIAYDVLTKRQSSSRPSSIPADAWFSDNNDLSRYFIYEETIKIHDGRILTLLTWRNERMLEVLGGY